MSNKEITLTKRAYALITPIHEAKDKADIFEDAILQAASAAGQSGLTVDAIMVSQKPGSRIALVSSAIGLAFLVEGGKDGEESEVAGGSLIMKGKDGHELYPGGDEIPEVVQLSLRRDVVLPLVSAISSLTAQPYSDASRAILSALSDNVETPDLTPEEVPTSEQTPGDNVVGFTPPTKD